jgi:Na+-translocating ferredoxin:NAD+ oxidoreductase subunit G
MKEILKLGGILLLVTAIAGAALSMVNVITKPRIEEQKRLVTIRALQAALPIVESKLIEPITKDDKISYYIGYTDTQRVEIDGYAFVAKGQGYSSIIETMVGIDTTGKIMGIKIMQQVETPGLGTKIEEVRYGESSSWFQDQFLNRVADEMVVDKDGGDIICVTGATISCRAVANSIKKGMAGLEEKLGEFKVN